MEGGAAAKVAFDLNGVSGLLTPPGHPYDTLGTPPVPS